MERQWDEWELYCVGQARKALEMDPGNKGARTVLEEFARGVFESFDWFDFDKGYFDK